MLFFKVHIWQALFFFILEIEKELLGKDNVKKTPVEQEAGSDVIGKKRRGENPGREMSAGTYRPDVSTT